MNIHARADNHAKTVDVMAVTNQNTPRTVPNIHGQAL